MVKFKGFARHSCRLFWVLGIFDDWPCLLSHVKCMVRVDLFLLRVLWETMGMAKVVAMNL